MGPYGKCHLNPMFPGRSSSEVGEFDSHGLQEAALDAHSLKPDVDSTACMQRSRWACAADAVLIPEMRTRSNTAPVPGGFRSAGGVVLSGPG